MFTCTDNKTAHCMSNAIQKRTSAFNVSLQNSISTYRWNFAFSKAEKIVLSNMTLTVYNFEEKNKRKKNKRNKKKFTL